MFSFLILKIYSRDRHAVDSGKESPNSRSAVADTAIRHFQEQALESVQKTPTKKSTLIIHGVSEVSRSFSVCLYCWYYTV